MKASRTVLIAGLLLLSVVPAFGCAENRSARLDSGLSPGEPQAKLETTGAVPAALLRKTSLRPATDPSERFDARRARAEAEAIAAFGVRAAGSEAEQAAADYVAQRLRSFGYEPVVREFMLPNGRKSRNVIAAKDGFGSSRTVVLGAHLDSKPPSAGANDNGSGVGVVLELARLFAESPPVGRTEFVFYGSEEIIDAAKPDGHHFGARDHVAQLTASERENIAGMISVDMVGYGTSFQVQTMRRGPQSLAELLLKEGRAQKTGLRFKKDLGRTGWSDHEPYELSGIPAVWIHWQDDPLYHTAGDVGSHLQTRPIEQTGSFLLRTLRSLDVADLEKLCDR